METKVLNIEVRTNSEETQQEFTRLREEIKSTTEQVDKLTETFGENSDEVKQAKGQLDGLRQAYDQMTQSATDLNATFDEVYGDMKPMMARVGEMEDRLYELSLAGKQNTQEYRDLITQIGNFRKVQMQTDMQVDASSQLMSQKMAGAIGGVASGFEMAEGASALFGVESEKLQETMVRLQSVMALTQGVQGIKEAIPSFKALGQSAKVALQGIKSGLAATGIGLLVVALGTIVAYWDDIKSAISGVSSEQEELNIKAEANVKAEQAKYDSLGGQENILRMQGKTEKEITEMKIKQIDAVIKATEAQLVQQENTKKAQVETAKRNAEITKMIIRGGMEVAALALRLMVAPIDLVLETANKVSEALGFGKITTTNMNKEISKFIDKASGSVATYFFDAEEVAKESDATIKETKNALTKLQNDKAGLQLSLKAMDEKAVKDKKDTNTKEVDEEKKKLEELAKLQDDARKQELDRRNEYLKTIEDLANQNYERTLSDEEREIRAVEEKYFELLEMAQGNADKIAIIEEAKMNELNDIYLKGDEEKRKIDEEARAKKLEQDKKDLEDARALQEKKVQMASDALGALMDLNDAFGAKDEAQAKKQFQRNKAFSIAQALINTYQAVTGALTAGGNPIKLATGAQFVEAGIALTSGLASVIKIAKTEFGASPSGGGGGGGGGGGSDGGSVMPTFNIVGNNAFSQASQLQQQPVKAYVVSKEVTSQQELDRNRSKNATW
jgi:hypothetical protein